MEPRSCIPSPGQNPEAPFGGLRIGLEGSAGVGGDHEENSAGVEAGEDVLENPRIECLGNPSERRGGGPGDVLQVVGTLQEWDES